MKRTIRFAIVLTILNIFAAQAYAITPEWMLRGPSLDIPKVFRSITINPTYRIGDEWGKKPVTQEDLASDVNFRRMALSTARVGGATGFFLGEFNGKMVMATNHHVCPSAGQCMGSTVNFPLLQIQVQVVDFYGTWTDVDLALFEIRVDNPKQKEDLLSVASPFAFNSVVQRGQTLTTIGFGVGDNPRRQIVANRDADCVVFSGSDEYRFMADPDDLNPGPYKAWSFANGCDVSHGDSGSAMMDRESGQVVGIIWTGRIPKSDKVQNSAFLKGLLENPTEDVWKELSYAVPAATMKPFLTEQVASKKVKPEHAETIKALLQ